MPDEPDSLTFTTTTPPSPEVMVSEAQLVHLVSTSPVKWSVIGTPPTPTPSTSAASIVRILVLDPRNVAPSSSRYAGGGVGVTATTLGDGSATALVESAALWK